MKTKSLALIGLMSILAACSTAPGYISTYSNDVTEYRTFLADLDRQINDITFNDTGSSNAYGIQKLRNEIYHVMGNTKSFDEYTYEQYENFRSLSMELYRRMCSEQQFVAEKAYLYELLISPDIDRQVASF